MFERFAEQGRQVIVLAQDEARALKHNYIGTEHILLGLLREKEGLASRVLESFDISVEEVGAQVAHIVGQGDEVTAGQIPFTPRAKRVLERSGREAIQLGHSYIGTEHILLGLLREKEGVAARILLDCDVQLDRVRDEVMRLVQGPGRREPPPGDEGDPRGSTEPANELEAITRAKEAAIEAGEFERAARLRVQERRLLHRVRGVADEHVSVEIGSAGPLWPRLLFVTPLFGWLLFGIALGIGILIGWLIWG